MLIQIYVANLPYGVTRPIGYNELMHHPESSYTRMSLLEVPYVIEAPHPQKKTRPTLNADRPSATLDP